MQSVRIPVLLVSLLLLSVVPLTEGNSGGIYNQSTGCSCHSASGTTAASVSISGHPASYSPGTTYTLSISVTGGVSGTNGGFSLEVSQGTLSAGGIGIMAVKVNSAGNSATHTTNSYRSWSVDWIAPAAGTGQATISVAGLTADNSGNYNGDRWATATYQVPEAGAAPNTPPTASNLVLGPSGATTTSQLALSYTYNDAENDPESGTTIDWFRDGVQIVNSGTTASASLTAKHQEWYAVVTPSDGSDAGTSVTSNTLIIANTIPSLTSVTIEPNSPETEDDLSYSAAATDDDLDPLTYETRWLLEGSVVSALDDSETVPSYATRSGENWSMEVRVSDGEATTAWQTAQTVQIGGVVQNTPPTVTATDVTPLAPKTGDDLSVTYSYADDDNDAEVRHEIEWYRNGVLDAVFKGSGIPSSSTEKGETWTARVRVSDGNAWSSWVSTNTVTIQNTAPVATSINLSHVEMTTTESATIEVMQTDLDGDGMAPPEVIWFKDGVRISSLDQSLTLPSTQTMKGEQWTAQVRTSDGTDLSENTLTASLSIINTAPTTSVELNQDASALVPLTAIVSTSDADDDETSFTVAWYRNGFLEASLDNQTTVPIALLGPGQTWSAEVIAHDGEAPSAPSLQSVLIQNIQPIAIISEVSSAPWLGELLRLDGSESTDMDGRILAYSWTWTDTEGGSGEATGAQFTFTPVASTSIKLTVADDSGDEASANLLVAPVQGPIIETLEAIIEGQTVVLEWTYNGPNANFSIERNGVVLEQIEEQNFADVPLTAGETVYTVRPVIDGTALQDGSTASVTAQVPATIETASSGAPMSASIIGILLLVIGIGSLVFVFMERRD